MRPSDSERLKHLLDALTEARDLLGDSTASEVEEDRKLGLALVKLIEIAGEAASRVSDEQKRRMASIPWEKLVATRNRLIHGYFDVDVRIVVQTILEDFPPLIRALEKVTRSNGL
ncbi:MAG: HepT-like ribonuclease domain-containing protein [Thermoanaerobaculia bacterium]